MGNDGVHDIDIARWGLGVETHPSRIAGTGNKFFFDDDQEWPDTLYCAFEYDVAGGKKKQLIYEQRIWSPYVQEGHENGCAWYGTEGMMVGGKAGGWQIFGRKNKLIEEIKAQGVDLPAHHEDFLSCIRHGGKPHAHIEIHHHSSSLCHLGNIVARTGRSLHFDPAKEQFVGDDDASKLLRRDYRDHWSAPKGA